MIQIHEMSHIWRYLHPHRGQSRRASLKCQRLKPYEQFAEMIERHWDSIAAYGRPENKATPGFVERLNNKIRVFQPHA